jgi:hypothetical protein
MSTPTEAALIALFSQLDERGQRLAILLLTSLAKLGKGNE